MTPTELRAAGNALSLGPVALAREMGEENMYFTDADDNWY